MNEDSKFVGGRAMREPNLLMHLPAIALCVLLIAGCSRKEPAGTEKTDQAPAAAAPAPPPVPPSTSLGVLASTRRAETAELQFVCMGNSKDSASTFRLSPGVKPDRTSVEFMKMLYRYNGICLSKEKPKKGNVYAVLSFEGEGTRKLSTNNYAATPSRYIGITDEASWLTDAQGKIYKPGFLAGPPSKKARQLAFEIPADASGLTWHDKDTAFPLKP